MTPGSPVFGGGRALVMGVLNVTPDSFSDGGRFFDAEAAVHRARQLVAEGADILDVGGESTRPGAAPVSEEDELRRVVPVLERLAASIRVPISIDTRKPAVAEACLRLGARIVNDVTGLREPEMIGVIHRNNAACIIMHMRGTPETMHRQTDYQDVVREVKEFLAGRAAAAREAGIREIAIDPGIGFAKTPQQSWEILRRLEEFTTLGYPVVAGVSRKRFLSTLADMQPVENRLEGTIAAEAIAVLNGASIIRAHDVKEARRAVAVAEAVRNA